MTDFLFPGLNLAVTTPFTPEGRIDFDRLEANLERYVAAGVDGVVLSSGTGMHVYLSRAESDELVARGAKAIAGRVKVIVQTSALLVEEVAARTRHAADCGADGVMVLPPFFEGPTDDQGVYDFYAAAAEGGLPIIGYNVPQAVGVGISPDLLGRLCEIPNFHTVKDSSGDLAAQADLIRTGLPVMNGADPLMPYALLAGAAGLIWGGANFAPRTCVALVAAAKQRRWDDARAIWRALEPAMNLIWQGDYVQSVYAAAEIAGYGAGAPCARSRPTGSGRSRPRSATWPPARRRDVTAAPKTFRTSQLPENPGVCGWAAMLPPRAGTPQLDAAITADVTVIGAGFAGLSAARRLAQLDPTLKVVALEAGIVGEGPAGRNSGFIIDLPHEVSSEDYGGDSLQKSREHIALQRRAVSFATEAAAERGWGPETLDPCGRYNLALTPDGDRHIADYAAQLLRLGEPHTMLDAREVAGITGSDAFSSGIHMPGTVIVQPAAYVRGLADSLEAPVRLFEGTPALSFERRGAGWLVRTPRGSVETGRIVLASNGYAERFGFFRGRLLHVYTYASMTEAFDPARLGGLRAWAATPATPMGTTLRRVRGASGDRLLVRSRYTYNPGLRVGEGTLRRAGAQHDRKFAHRFPALNGTRMEYRWGGAMALTWNSVPAFGEVEEGVLAACGCNGLGASNATASGLAAAEMLLGVDTELTRIYRGFAQPQALPPQPLTLVGARATLAFREWKAGPE